MSGAPADDTPARESVRSDLDTTLFVEAGAGSGKSTAIVSRIVELVATDTADITSIAAITFTDAAAAELRDRVREALERTAAGDVDDLLDPDYPHRSDTERSERGDRCRAAVAQVDGAAISTLHSFAQRILRDHPLEAGLPPGLTMLDQIQSAVDFQERWDDFLERLYADDRHQRVIVRALALGIGERHLHAIAKAFNENWDLVDDADLPDRRLTHIDASPILQRVRDARSSMGRCTDAEDKLLTHLENLAGTETRLARIIEDPEAGDLEVLELLRDTPKLSKRVGSKNNWEGIEPDEIRSLLSEADDSKNAIVERAAAEALSQLLIVLRDLTLEAVNERRIEGRLEFHDLLVFARDLLRSDPDVAATLRDRYSHLLIDEFQDTDPIQAELAVRIASPTSPANDNGEGSGWQALQPEAGRLCFVGDPKQSIYRFRRADIELFIEVRDVIVGSALQLNRNFRSVPGIIDWVNAVFTDLFEDDLEPAQPRYIPLAATRDAAGTQPPVVLLGGVSEENMPEVRAAEAEDIASAIEHAVGDPWPIGDEAAPASLTDIAILVPTTTSVSILTGALEAHGIAYRLETSSLVYRSDEVRDLVSVLRAIDDPTDQVAIVAALRSPFFGCGDDDLLRWRRHRGRFDYHRRSPEALPVDDPVRRGLRDLAELHDLRWWTDVSSLIEEVLRRRRVLELALEGQRPRDSWRRLRFVAEQARAFSKTSGTDLRRWLTWVALQTEDGARTKEVVLPETDDNAVRILTVHGSKGLEFPIVMLAGLNSKGRNDRKPILWDKNQNRPEASAGPGLATEGYDELHTHEQDMDGFEAVRLLYVATTRARDHLVVSLHHKQKTKCHAATLEELCGTYTELWRRLPEAEPAAIEPAAAPETRSVDDGPEARATWITERTARLDAARRPRAIAPTTIARLAWEHEQEAAAPPPEPHEAVDLDPELAKAEPDPERPPWQRGRAGTAIGRAVHASLQLADLATGDDIAAIARVEAAAEGVAGRASDVEKLARTALDAPIVRAAVATGRYWREIYVGAPVEGRVLEGFVDLLVEEDDGYVVVDYKTDQAATEEELDAKLERYRLQGAAYALALEPVLDKPVTRCVFVFLRPDGAVERSIADLADAKDRAGRLLAEGI